MHESLSYPDYAARKVQITFDEALTEPQRAALEEAGWRFRPKAGAWERRLSKAAQANARALLGIAGDAAIADARDYHAEALEPAL